MSAVAGRQRSPAELQARLGFRLPHQTPNGAARLAALMGDAWTEREPTSLVGYHARNRVLVIGPEERGTRAAERLGAELRCTLLVPHGASDAEPTPSSPEPAAGGAPRTIRAALAAVSGHLGRFGVRAWVNGEEVDLAPSLLTAHEHFDLVLDLGDVPQIASEILPPGYHHAPAGDEQALERALAEIPDMVGDFEKPRFFDYNPDICAHGASGIAGCTRCLEACPTDAIRSAGDTIEVDPHLCQGAGSCATACPTGAITYAYPRASDMLGSLRGVLAAYRDAGGGDPHVLFHDAEAGRAWLASHADALPENVIPYEVEEIGSVGMEAWLALIAYGAAGVGLLCPAATPASVRREVAEQRGFAAAILEGMGYPATLVQVHGGETEAASIGGTRAPGIAPATFGPLDEKRTNLRLAVDHLHEQAGGAAATIGLPAGAPFGEIMVDAEACTLCMACASVCPAAAIADGGTEPKLFFIEGNCVQCGVCEVACPEDAISLRPRFVYDAGARRESRLLNEDQPFHCVGCGKPFATTRVIETMRGKLAGHWMFQKPEAIKRLEMCEDCRVRDMFKDGGGMLDVGGGEEK